MALVFGNGVLRKRHLSLSLSLSPESKFCASLSKGKREKVSRRGVRVEAFLDNYFELSIC